MPTTASAISNELHLLYRCGFEVEGALACGETVTDIINAVRHSPTNDAPVEWEVPKERVTSAWFDNGGKCASAGSDRSTIVTDRLDDNVGEIRWALSYERPESAVHPGVPCRSSLPESALSQGSRFRPGFGASAGEDSQDRDALSGIDYVPMYLVDDFRSTTMDPRTFGRF